MVAFCAGVAPEELAANLQASGVGASPTPAKLAGSSASPAKKRRRRRRRKLAAGGAAGDADSGDA